MDLESPCLNLETTDGVSAGPPAAPSPLHPRLVNRVRKLQLQSTNGATSSRAALHSFRKPSKPYQADDMPNLDSASQEKLAPLQQARRACLVP